MKEDYDSDEEDIDPNNYKGIYFEEEPGSKWQDPETGAHFKFQDMCLRLEKVAAIRRSEERKHERLLDIAEKKRENSFEAK